MCVCARHQRRLRRLRRTAVAELAIQRVRAVRRSSGDIQCGLILRAELPLGSAAASICGCLRASLPARERAWRGGPSCRERRRWSLLLMGMRVLYVHIRTCVSSPPASSQLVVARFGELPARQRRAHRSPLSVSVSSQLDADELAARCCLFRCVSSSPLSVSARPQLSVGEFPARCCLFRRTRGHEVQGEVRSMPAGARSAALRAMREQMLGGCETCSFADLSTNTVST